MAAGKVLSKVVLFVVVLVALLAAAEAARLTKSALGGGGLEMDDLSLEQQQQVMDLGSRLEHAARQLLTQDPYHTY